MPNDVQDDDVTQVNQGTGQDIDLSSLAGMQQPLEGGGMPGGPFSPGVAASGPPAAANLPGGIAAPQGAPPMAPGMQPRPMPTVSQQARSHGGLLTGLAGVLLDGLSAGMQAQATAPLYGAPGSNFARGFMAQQQMPLIKQQQQQAMWDSLTKVEQDKALMAQSYMNQLQTHMLSMRLQDDVVSGMMDSDREMSDQAVADGWGERVATTTGANARKQAMDMVHDLRTKDTDFQNMYFAYPLSHDDQGDPTDWQVVKLDPNQTLKQAQAINFPYFDPASGEVKQGTYTVQPGTRVKDFITTREAMIKGAASALPGEMKRTGKAAGKQLADTDLVRVHDPNNVPYVMSKAEATQHGFTEQQMEKASAKDVSDAKNNAKSLNDMQVKANELGKWTGALDQGTVQTGIIAEALSGEPKGGIEAMVRRFELSGASDQTIGFIRAVLSLREASLALPKQTTGGARVSDTQAHALWATLPSGTSRNSADGQNQMRQFQQNLDRLWDPVDRLQEVRRQPAVSQGAAPGAARAPGGAQPAPVGTVVKVGNQTLTKQANGQWAPQQ